MTTGADAVPGSIIGRFGERSFGELRVETSPITISLARRAMAVVACVSSQRGCWQSWPGSPWRVASYAPLGQREGLFMSTDEILRLYTMPSEQAIWLVRPRSMPRSRFRQARVHQRLRIED